MNPDSTYQNHLKRAFKDPHNWLAQIDNLVSSLYWGLGVWILLTVTLTGGALILEILALDNIDNVSYHAPEMQKQCLLIKDAKGIWR